MKQTFFLLLGLFTFGVAKAQVGVNTTSPTETLDVNGSMRVRNIRQNASNASARDSIMVFDGKGVVKRATANQVVGQASARFPIGMVANFLRLGDFDGWVKLDGRVKTSLTPSQQAQATLLGIGINLPNATNSVAMQNGLALGQVSGTNAKTITRSNLPNVPVTGQLLLERAGESWTNQASGVLSHTLVATSSYRLGNDGDAGRAASRINFNWNLNNNVTQQAFDVTPRSLSVNTFVYLGE